MALTIAVISAVHALGLCLVANSVTTKARAYRRLARTLDCLARLCLVGFSYVLGIA